MALNVLAKRYAKALFSIAKENRRLDEMREELSFLVRALLPEEELAGFWRNPLASFLLKKEILEGTLGRIEVDRFTRAFILQLLEKGRLGQLPDILKEYDLLVAASRKALEVKATSARELSGDTLERLRIVLEKKLGRRVNFVSEIDESVVGGVRLQFDDYVYDGTVASRLDAFLRQ